MKKTRFIRLTTLAVAGLTFLAPISLAGACTISKPYVSPETSLMNSVEAIKVALDGKSFNHTVQWQNRPQSLNFVEKYLFLSGNYPTRQRALEADASQWQEELPKTVDYVFSRRFLWVRAVLYPTASFATLETVINITTSSNIQFVPTDVSSEQNFKNVDLSNIHIIGQMNNPIVDESRVILPQGTKIVYGYKTATRLTNAELVNRLIQSEPDDEDGEQLEKGFLDRIQASLEVVDERYVITAPLPNTLVQNDILFVSRLVPSSVVTTLLEVVHPFYDLSGEEPIGKDARGNDIYTYGLPTSSTNSAVEWNTFEPFPTETRVDSVAFLYGDYLSEKSITAKIWSATPPRVIDFEQSKRNLWARINVRNASFPELSDYFYLNLTVSSRIREIRASLDNLPSTSGVDLRRVFFRGTPGFPSINTTFQIDPNLQIEYRITSTEVASDASSRWQTEEEFMTTLVQKQTLFRSDVEIASIHARLQVNNIRRFVIKETREAAVNVNSFFASYNDLILGTSTKAGVIARVIAVDPVSTFDNIVWQLNNPGFIFPLLGFEYLIGPYASLAQAQNAPATSWTKTLPTRLTGASQWVLWVRPIWDSAFKNAPKDIYNATNRLPFSWQLLTT